jgi:hypothetical protein
MQRQTPKERLSGLFQVILGFLLGSQARRADGGRLAGLGFLLGLLILPFSVVRRLQADGCTTMTHRT